MQGQGNIKISLYWAVAQTRWEGTRLQPTTSQTLQDKNGQDRNKQGGKQQTSGVDNEFSLGKKTEKCSTKIFKTKGLLNSS